MAPSKKMKRHLAKKMKRLLAVDDSDESTVRLEDVPGCPIVFSSYKGTPSQNKRSREVITAALSRKFNCNPFIKEEHVKSDSEIISILKNAEAETLTDSANFPLLPPSAVKDSATSTGAVVGKLLFDDSGDLIDCTKFGSGGIGVPRYCDLIKDISSPDDLFILLVANGGSFSMLAHSRFYNRIPCIIITAQGPPHFLNMISRDLNLPVLALADVDPYALKMLSFYGRGVKNMKWLGIRPTDLDDYKIPPSRVFPMTTKDIRTGNALLEHDDFVKVHPQWVEQLELMMKSKRKVSVQALSSFGLLYLIEVFLPIKLQQKDWI